VNGRARGSTALNSLGRLGKGIVVLLAALLNGQAFNTPPIATHPTTAQFRLFLELRHYPSVSPTGTSQIVIMLVTVFFQSTPHLRDGHMPPKCTASHDHISYKRALHRMGVIMFIS
jgi:hypothetical protein